MITLSSIIHVEMSVLSSDALHQFLCTAEGTPYYALFYTALYTGMRRGELLGLRWCDVDLNLAVLSVVQNVGKVGNGDMKRGPRGPLFVSIFGRSGRARTPDHRFWRPVLYQLSYAPTS